MFSFAKKPHQEGAFKTLIKGGFINLLFGAVALTLDTVLEIPPLPINKSTSFILFLILIILYGGLLIWSALCLVSAKKKKSLATKGPYALTRHPMYVGIVLLINPALAILFASWSLLEACIIFYFLWRYFAKKEEQKLLKHFGNTYKEYSKKTGCLFPRIC